MCLRSPPPPQSPLPPSRLQSERLADVVLCQPFSQPPPAECSSEVHTLWAGGGLLDVDGGMWMWMWMRMWMGGTSGASVRGSSCELCGWQCRPGTRPTTRCTAAGCHNMACCTRPTVLQRRKPPCPGPDPAADSDSHPLSAAGGAWPEQCPAGRGGQPALPAGPVSGAASLPESQPI